jgi:outer membrane protein assembly factor BamB
VVVGADNGKLYAVDVTNGVKKWEFKTGDWIRAAPAIVGEKVIFGSWDRCVYALSLADGKPLWRYVTNHEIHASPAVYKGRVLVGSGDWIAYGLNLETGKPDWHRLGSGPIRSVAVYRDMFVALRQGRDSSMSFLCPESGGPAMKQMRAGHRYRAAFGAPAFSGDWLFYGRWYNGGPGILNLRKEKSHRRTAVTGCLETPLIAGKTMILATINGTVEAYSLSEKPTAPRKLWEWKAPSGKMFRTAPVAAGGHIVVGNDDGFIYGFRYN